MENISIQKELSLYNLDGKWNDYIGVQKEVLQVLKKENYFNNNEIMNRKTGITVKINAKGIKETLGTGKRFQALPKKLKQYKIATLRYLKQIIEDAELLVDNVENIHDESGYLFVYLGKKILLDGNDVYMRITVKKRVNSNWFWIHNIDEKKL